MGQFAIDAERPTHERKRSRMLLRSAIERDGKRVRSRLRDAGDNRPPRSFECANVLTVERESVDNVRRESSEHADRKVQPIRGRDVYFVTQ